jgi:hypothetical protein
MPFFSHMLRPVAALAAAAFITLAPTAAFAHGGIDDEYTEELITTNVMESPGSSMVPIVVGAGAVAAIGVTGTVIFLARRKK